MIKKFISDMIKRGEAVLKENSLPPGKIMSYKDGVWTSRDTQTGVEKVVSQEELTHIGSNGADMPTIFGQEKPLKCVMCGSHNTLHLTRYGQMCETCIQMGVETRDIQEKSEPIQSDEVKEDE